MIDRFRKAFTIVELLVVIVVIGILAAISLISYTGITKRANVASLLSDLGNSSRQLKYFQVDNIGFPDTIDCSIPDSETNKCLKTSNNAQYITYQHNNLTNPPTFLLVEKIGDLSYCITNDSVPKECNVPLAPVSVSAVANNASRITISWTAPSDPNNIGVTGYEVYRGNSSGDINTKIAILGNVNSYQNDGLSANTNYFYKIRAINIIGDGIYSEEASASTVAYGGIDTNTLLMLHGETLNDNSYSPKITTNHGAVVSSAQSKFGGSSLYTSGLNYLSVADSSDWDLPGAFTIDAWIRPTADGSFYILGGNPGSTQADTTLPSWMFYVDTSTNIVHFGYYTAYSTYPISMTVSAALDPNNWYHVAVSRDSSSNIRIFVNGNQVGSTLVNSTSITNAFSLIGAGGVKNGNDNRSTGFLTGYIDEVRFSKGVARWTSNFTIPDQAYTLE